MKKIHRIFAGLLLAGFVLLTPAQAPAADLVITAGNVKYVSGPQPQLVVAGTTITAGQPVYLDTTTNQYKLADADLAGAQTPTGIALTGASAGGYMILAPNGCRINIGATVTKNTVYYLSANAGGIAPLADITTGWNTVTIGIAASTTDLIITMNNTGITN